MRFLEGWAIILGASSGFGEACAVELSQAGMDIVGVHLDRRTTLPNADRIMAQIRNCGREALFFNVNAADSEKRMTVLDTVRAKCGASKAPVRVLVHSLAFGTLKPYIAAEPDGAIGPHHMAMTLDVMAHSLVYWVQDAVRLGLLGEGSRIFSLTSSGGARVWKTYGAVSAAKAALEAHTRQLAVELAPLGISVNAIRAGVTDTPALRKIPGHEEMIRQAREQNPWGRLTTPEDVAAVIALLSHPKASWVTGNVIGADGGEYIAG